ncbi:MAG: UPF0149 family protein [Thiotrichales bacterium]|nr:UPF0149 family protein [Thiotrichales bacterium]
MTEEEYELIYSPLRQSIEHHSKTYQIEIYRSRESSWILEVYYPDGSSIVWEDEFHEDKDALAEGLKAIHEGYPGDQNVAPNLPSDPLMDALDPPLSEDELAEEELEWLDNFLLSRVPEDGVQNSDDEGILNISELDGFLTAIASGSKTIVPSKWLPAIWGDFEPNWEGTDDFKEVVGLFMRHMDTILAMLTANPSSIRPIFEEVEVKDHNVILADEWCTGYLRAMNLSQDLWITDNREVQSAIGLINLFGSDNDTENPLRYSQDDIRKMVELLPSGAISIHQYFFYQQGRANQVNQPSFTRDMPKVGRNDPCSCGSGKKFKKCCLH